MSQDDSQCDVFNCYESSCEIHGSGCGRQLGPFNCCTLVTGDCLELIPQLPANSIDCIVTDPPYGQSWRSNRRLDKFDYISGDKDQTIGLAGLSLALGALKSHRHIYVFGRWDFSKLLVGGTAELIWDKEQMSGGDVSSPWGTAHEYIQFGVYVPSAKNRERGDGRLAARLRKGSVLRCARLNSRAVSKHPTEKPVGILRELIESSSCIGETILDPFAGSGSTLEAAQLEGRHYLGFEIESAERR